MVGSGRAHLATPPPNLRPGRDLGRRGSVRRGGLELQLTKLTLEPLLFICQPLYFQNWVLPQS